MLLDLNCHFSFWFNTKQAGIYAFGFERGESWINVPGFDSRQEAMAAMPTQFRGESDGNLGLQCIHTVVNQRHSCQNDNGADLKKKCCTIWWCWRRIWSTSTVIIEEEIPQLSTRETDIQQGDTQCTLL